MSLGTLAEGWPLLVALGCASGFFSGLLGIGGGTILVPALVAGLPLLGIDGPEVPKIAMATSLALIIPTSIASAQTHASKGAVDWRLLLLLGPSIVAGAFVSAVFAQPRRRPRAESPAANRPNRHRKGHGRRIRSI